MSNASFVHLRLHSEYSIIDSTVRINPKSKRNVANFCQSEKQTALAITDDVNFFGMVTFYNNCISHGIKPIIGTELKVQTDYGLVTVVLLAMNDQGYRNLCKLISQAWLSPRIENKVVIQFERLKENTSDLILLCGGLGGCIAQSLDSKKSINTIIDQWQSLFPDRFYLEVSRINQDNEEKWIYQAVQLSQTHNLPLVATNKICFLATEDYQAHQARVGISLSLQIDDKQLHALHTSKQYFRSSEEMETLFHDLPSAIENSNIIAQRCNFRLELGKVLLPVLPEPEGQSLNSHFKELTKLGLEKRLINVPTPHDIYWQRLDNELEVIIKMNFVSYFLIVADFIGWSKKNDIPVGPGRGSGAGSLVAYSLNITDINPIPYNLVFERFLNYERNNMPDFDIDFCMERRDEVIEYVAEKYGYNQVSQIITFGTLSAKAVIRDVTRVMGLPYSLGDRLSKLIPKDPGITLTEVMKHSKEFIFEYQKDEETRSIVELSLELEGLVRNVSKHAGGVIIAPSDSQNYCPLYKDEQGESKFATTQFHKNDVESIGLVKFDFLGLRTLTIIDWAIKWSNNLNKNNPIDLDNDKLDDPLVYEMLSQGDTMAVFQLESQGIQRYITQMKPTVFEDLVAMVALYRPGPLGGGVVDSYMDIKNGKKNVEELHPDINEILLPTNGVIIYQEQVMQVAQKLAGFSLGQADVLRQAMGKKNEEKMKQQRILFITGTTNRGINEALAHKIFDLMYQFSEYGFNKSHAAAYALLVYKTSWLKVHHTSSFFAAIMSGDMDSHERLSDLFKVAKARSIHFLDVHVNHSTEFFLPINKTQVYWSIASIKGIGTKVAKLIVKERKNDGDFSSLMDFSVRMSNYRIGKKALETLILAGTFDCFNDSRTTMLKNIDKIINFSEQSYQNKKVGQVDLFASSQPSVDYPALVTSKFNISTLELLYKEKLLLGINLNKTVYDLFFSELKYYNVNSIAQKIINQKVARDQVISILGEVEKVKHSPARERNNQDSKSKASAEKFEARISDGSHTLEVIISNKELVNYLREEKVLTKNKLLIFSGKLSIDRVSRRARFNCSMVESPEDIRKRELAGVHLKVRSAHIQEVLDLFETPEQKSNPQTTLTASAENLSVESVKSPVQITIVDDDGQLSFNCKNQINMTNELSVKITENKHIKTQWQYRSTTQNN